MMRGFPLRPTQPTMDEDEFRERNTIPAPAPDEKQARIERWHTLYAAFDRLDPDRQVDAKVITADMAHLGPNARAILLKHSERLRAGAMLYGRDFDEARNWVREVTEELLDAQNYAERALQTTPSTRVETIQHLLTVIVRLAAEEMAEQREAAE